MTHQTIFQTNAPRHASIRYQISQETWKSGFQNFFLHRVPFSGRSNVNAAKKHVQLIRNIVEQIPKNSAISILELGTGHGFLSKNILDLLYQEYPDIYQRITITITDYSGETLKLLKSSEFLKAHITRCIFKSEHTLFKTESEQSFLYAYSSYLYDCFPCEIFQNIGGQNLPIQINTSINDNLLLLDTSQDIEKLLNATQLRKLWDEVPELFITKYGAQILKHLNEEFTQSGVSINTPLASATKNFTNYSLQIISHIQQVERLLEAGGAYVFSDIIQTIDSNPLGLSKSYNGILCAPITSDYILKSVNLIDQKIFESTSDFLVINQTDKYNIRSLFNSTFDDVGTSEIEQFLNDIRQKPLFANEIHDKFLTLSISSQSDYFLLKETCNQILQKCQNSPTDLTPSVKGVLANYAERLIHNFKELAADGWRLRVLLGIADQLPADVVCADADRILRLCPDDADLLRTVSMYCVAQKQYRLAREYLVRAWKKASCVISENTPEPEDINLLKQLLKLTEAHRIHSA